MFNEDQVQRYARHIILPNIGGKGQRKLLDSSVLVIGAGGLGSPIAMYLAAAGIGKLGVVDFDAVDVSNLQLSSSTVSKNGSLRASVTVTNTGRRKGDEVVQLYLHDPVASISQPVRRLRGFERVTLDPGKSRSVTFTLDKSDFGFYDNGGRFVVEPGTIDVYGGDSSTASMKQSFSVRGF